MSEEERPTTAADVLSALPDDCTEIDLHSIPLDCDAASLLSRFRSVEVLNLSNCQLHKVPDPVTLMTNLKRLDLSHNSLEFLPGELGRLERLENVNINGCGFQSPYRELQGSPSDVARLLKWLNRPVIPATRRFYPSPPGDSPGTFVVVSYNILAPHCETRRERFPLTPIQYLERDNRIPQIKQQIELAKGDIYCLQEMEGGLFRDDFKGFMEGLGFTGYFCPKSRASGMLNQQRRDLVMGEATFVRSSRFDVIATKTVELREHRLSSTLANHAELKKHDETAMFVLVKTRFCPGIDILIVNLHLYWDALEEEVRASQLHIAIEAAFEFGYQHSDKFDIILAGDFNSTPASKPLMLLNSRKEGFYNAYHVCGYCPPFTMYAYNWKVWIDHIFSTCWGIQPISVLGLGDIQNFQKNYCALPASGLPSDHLMIAAAFTCRFPRSYPPPRVIPVEEKQDFVVTKPDKRPDTLQICLSPNACPVVSGKK